jgi:hypothetical protein
MAYGNNGSKKYERKDKKEDKKKAKVEAGSYSLSRKRAEKKAERRGTGKTDYSENPTVAAIKDAAKRTLHKIGLAKSPRRVRKGGPGNIPKKTITNKYEKIDKPELEGADTKTRSFTSTKDGKVVEVESKRTVQSGKSAEELKKKTEESGKRVAFRKVTDAGYKEAPEFKSNKEKQAAYEKRREERRVKKAKEAYKKGSRTEQSKETQESNIEEHRKTGARKSYVRRKKEGKTKRRSKRIY